MAAAPKNPAQTIQPGINAFLAAFTIFRRNLGQFRNGVGQRLVVQFPAEPLGGFFGNHTAAGAIFAFNNQNSFHYFVVPNDFSA